jgi:hypothetical protein
LATTKLTEIAGEKPAPAEAGKVVWGEAVEGLQAGMIPLGGVATKDWPQPFLCAKCLVLNRMLVRSKCEDCGVECNSNRKLRLCESCAAKKRVCQACLAAKPSGSAFTEGEPLVFEVHLRNTGEAPKDVTGAGRVFEQALVFTPPGGGLPRCARFAGARPMGGGGMAPQQLNKGQQAAWVVSVGGPDWQFEDASPAPRDATAKPVPALPTGKYAVKAAHSGAKVATGAVEIEIKAAAGSSVPAGGAEPRDPGSRPDRPAAGEWQKLFADEGWYKNQAGEEQVYTGTLEGVPAGGPSTLQRNSYYKLGDRTLYTGAKKLPALDALVGKKVEVRGKPVDMALEGREISEIWPAEVREAGADAPAAGAGDEGAARRLAMKWIKDNKRDATWKDVNGGAPVAEDQIAVIPDPNRPQLWQVTIRFKRGGVFGFHIDKANGQVLLPLD